MAKHDHYLPEEEVRRLFAAAQENNYGDYALLALIYFLALRSSEAAVIKRSEINFSRGYITIHVLKRFKAKKDPKTGAVLKARKPAPTVDEIVDPALLSILAEHIRRSPRSEWLFPHHKDPARSMTRSRVKYTYYKAARKIGLGKNYDWHPHLLRISRGTHKAQLLAAQHVPPLEAAAQIQETLRHASPAMAFEYVKRTSETQELSRKVDAALAQRILGGGAA